MSGREQYLIEAGEAARRGLATAGRRLDGDAPAAALRRAIALEVSGGLVTAGVVGANGVIVDTIPGCPVWGGAAPEVDDQILLQYEGDRGAPIVIVPGGGSGGSSVEGAWGGIQNRFFSD